MTELSWLGVIALLALLLSRIWRRGLAEFREMRSAAAIERSLLSTPHVHRNVHTPDETWIEYEETIEAGGLRLHRRDVAAKVHEQHFLAMETVVHRHPDQPHVRCGRCHGTSFTIRFGDYCVLAACTACGLSDEVYSG